MHNIAIDPDPEEIYVDDATVTHGTEAYMVSQMSAYDQHKGYVHDKVDSGAGSNIMPLSIFQHLYSNKLGPYLAYANHILAGQHTIILV